MKNLIAALLLLSLPTVTNALELELSLMGVKEPLYENVYDDELDDDGLVGRIEISHAIRITKYARIKFFATHLSLWSEVDPHYGINGFGVGFIFNLP